MSNTYLYEKMVATRQVEIRRDMQLSRRHAHAEQSPTFVQHSAGKLGALLVGLGSRLQRTEQQREVSIS